MLSSRNQKNLIVVATLALGATALFGLSGCAPTHSEPPTQVDSTEVEFPTQVDSVAVREAELEAREQALAEQQRVLTASLKTLEARLDTVENRELPRVATPSIDPIPRPTPTPEIRPVQPIPEPVTPFEPDPVPVARTRTLRLPAELELELEVLETVSTETAAVGDPVQTRLTRDLVSQGVVAIPAGSWVVGSVNEITPAKKIGGKTTMQVEFDRIELASGKSVAIQSFLAIQGRRQSKKDAATIGGSVAGGAVLGHVLDDDDRGRGAVLGAILGAAIGTAVAANNGENAAVLEAGSLAQVSLELPVHVTVTDSPAPAAYARR